MSKIKKELIIHWRDFPNDIQDLIEEKVEDRGLNNNSYIKHYVHDTQKPRDEYKGGEILYVDEDIDYITERGDCPISDYLLDEEGIKQGEMVKIEISW